MILTSDSYQALPVCHSSCSLQVNRARQGELQALAVRKYLDALCVYFWAATSLLFSIVTFGL